MQGMYCRYIPLIGLIIMVNMRTAFILEVYPNDSHISSRHTGCFSPDATARSTIILILSSLISRSDVDGGG
jgi:hypothetical protein